MKTSVAAVVVICSLAWSLLLASPVQAESLQGKVQTHDGTPVAGLTVYLVHPSLGRSTPILTASDGTFVFLNVPSIADDFYLEIYWGRDLIYWQRVPVHGAYVLPSPIVVGG